MTVIATFNHEIKIIYAHSTAAHLKKDQDFHIRPVNNSMTLFTTCLSLPVILFCRVVIQSSRLVIVHCRQRLSLGHITSAGATNPARTTLRSICTVCLLVSVGRHHHSETANVHQPWVDSFFPPEPHCGALLGYNMFHVHVMTSNIPASTCYHGIVVGYVVFRVPTYAPIVIRVINHQSRHTLHAGRSRDL